MHPFARAVADVAATRALLSHDSRVLVAVSGGPDSCALLLALREAADGGALPAPVAVGHLHHGMRGAAADDDAAFVADLARRCGLPCAVGRASLSGANEADARRARYAFLTDAARERGADTLATGHTADDQAETVLLRVLRGTSVDGLAGIPVRRALAPDVAVVRPLLELSRAQVRDYVAHHGIVPRHDPTNDDPRYPRSRVRALLPALADAFQPQVGDALRRLAENAARDAAYLEQAADDLEARARDGDALRVPVLREAAPALRGRVLLRWLRRTAPASATEEAATLAGVRRLEALLEAPGDLWLPGAVRVRGDARELRVALESASGEREWEASLPVPGAARLPDGRWVRASWSAPGPWRRGDAQIDLAAEAASAGLRMRGALPGDRIAPLGMAGRSRPVRDLLREAGVAASARDGWPLAVCAASGEVLWVAGVAQAERTRVAQGAAQVVRLRLEN